MTPILLILAACAQDDASRDGGAAASSPDVPTIPPQAPTTPSSAGSEEICDGIDNDLDGLIDEGLDSRWYEDADADGAGNPDSWLDACERPPGYVPTPDDCDDTNERIYDDAPDACDGLDNDCDDVIDEDHRVGWQLSTVHHDGYVYVIDPVAGTVSPLSQLWGLTPYEKINSADSRDGNLSVVHNLNWPQSPRLQELNFCSGELVDLGHSGVGNMPGIAFGPDGTLYGLDSDGDRLVAIDIAAGTTRTVVTFTDDINHTGLAWDCTRQKLWVADDWNDQVFWVDLESETIGGHVSTDVPFDQVGIEYDPQSHQLYASTGDALYHLDPETGQGTHLMDFPGLSVVNDLALFEPCP